MRRALGPALWLAGLALAGCASLSEHECRAGGWEAIGRADGERGAPADEIERHREACAKHGIAPQAEAWRAGHAQGLTAYCTPAGGYVAGRDGSAYHEVCAGSAEERQFLAAFRHGHQVNTLLREVQELNRRLRDVEARVAPGQYSERAVALSDALRRKVRELERLDRRYALDYGAPELTGAEVESDF